MLRYSDFGFNVIGITFFMTKGYRYQINLSSVVVVGHKESVHQDYIQLVNCRMSDYYEIAEGQRRQGNAKVKKV